MIRSLYFWTLRLAEHERAVWALACLAFAESSFFPIPPDALLIPMIIANPKKAWLFASVATTFSVFGGLLGYVIGAVAFEQIGRPILDTLGKAEAVMEYSKRFNDFGFWTILTAGITPFPFKVITIMSGATNMPLGIFLSTALLARGFRFFMIAFLLNLYGESTKYFIERYLNWVFLAAILLVFCSIVIMRSI